MTDSTTDAPPARPTSLFARVRVWHLGLLVAFVAFAIADLQNHRRFEPVLIALAGAGYALYWLIGWFTWPLARRLEPRLGSTVVLILYLAAMAGLFLVATVLYLLIEHRYLTGGW